MNRRLVVRILPAAVALFCVAAVGVRGQAPPVERTDSAVAAQASESAQVVSPFASDSAAAVVRVHGEGRWLQGAARATSVPMESGGADVHVRRRWLLRRPRNGSHHIEIGDTEYQVSTDSTNRVLSVRVRPTWSYFMWDPPHERGLGQSLGFRRSLGHPHLRLPSSQLWDLFVPGPSGPVEVGRSWTDSLDFVAAPTPDHLEELRGRWRFTAVGDTVLDGRTMVRVNTEARVNLREWRPVDDAAFVEPMRVERVGAGTIRGWFVLDTVMGIRRAGADTIRLSGEATLTLQDGRAFTEPASFEGTRSWATVDSAADAAAREAGRKATGGMLFVSETPEPLAADEAALRSLAAGDTATWLAQYSGGARARRRPRLDRAEWDRIAPFLNDPGRVWHHGIEPKWIYTGLQRDLLRIGPVAGEPDSTWVCTPADCSAIIDEMISSEEPRLRDLGLIGRFAFDAATWADSIIARAEAGHLLLAEAARVARGDGIAGSAGPFRQAPGMPDPGAEWRAWLAWTGGELRLREMHDLSLRYYTARTGRDPLSELEERWPEIVGAESDSARLVVGALLRRFDRLPHPGAAALHRELTSANATRIAAARRELGGLERAEEAEGLGDVAARALLGPALDSMLAVGRAPWPSVTGAEDLREGSLGQGFHGARDVPVFIRGEGAPVGLEEGRSVERIAAEEFQARDRRRGGVIVGFAPVLSWGDLVRLRWDWSAWLPREEDEAPTGYAGGETIWLVRTASGWAVAHWSAWIT